MIRPVTKSEKPDNRAQDTVVTRITDFNDGVRLRHWVDHNSVKIYNEQNNLRVETTINDPGKFKVFRHKQGQNKNETKQRLPMRKGVMDTPLRAAVSQDVNNRLMNDLSLLKEKTPICNIIDELIYNGPQNLNQLLSYKTSGKGRFNLTLKKEVYKKKLQWEI